MSEGNETTLGTRGLPYGTKAAEEMIAERTRKLEGRGYPDARSAAIGQLAAEGNLRTESAVNTQDIYLGDPARREIAAEQLDALIAEAKEALAAEGRREHLEQAAELARERYGIEVQAEEEIGSLLATLSELEQLDRRQCQELRAGGAEHPTEPFGWTLEAWLLTRLAGGVSENPRHQGFAAKTLPELDGLAEPTGADA